ncbi:MAG: Rne/Rng family ribonuclease [Thiobacillus sp.]
MKRMLFNATQAEELRVAIVDGQKLVDLDIESASKEQRKGNIYKGVVTRVEPSLEAAFIDYGCERHGFLPFKEIARSCLPGNGKVPENLKEGQELLVQVEKDERGNKGAALTTFISLAGRYVVLMPNNPRGGGVSRRIEGEDRNELRDTMAQVNVPEGMSLIARTAGIGRSAEEFQWDLDYLMRIWTAIDGAAADIKAPDLIYLESNLITRAIRDHFSADIGEILIDTDDVYEQARVFMENVMPTYVGKVKLYRDDVPLFSRFQIEHQIESAYSRQVNLPSGGAIVIDHTEALVSVDVNSARATKGSDVEQTATSTNLEAADEVARQMRLRDLGGLIVIDFIDMENPKNQREVENRLKDALRYDRARVQTGKISRFGLLEMSRQRLQPSLGETSYNPCPRCHGTGHIRGTESSALHILRILGEEAMKENTGAVHVQLPVDVATFLLNEKRVDIHTLESRLKVNVVLIPNVHMETPNYTIERLRHDELNRSDAAEPSYKLAIMPEAEQPYQPTQAAAPARQEAAVKSIPPAQPAPTLRPAQVTETAAQSGLFDRIFGWFKKRSDDKPAEVAVGASTSEARPQARPERRDRKPAQRRRNEGRGDNGKEPREERQAAGRNELREPREPRPAGEPRPPRQPRPPRAKTETDAATRVADTATPRENTERDPAGEEKRESRNRRGRGNRRPREDREITADAGNAETAVPTNVAPARKPEFHTVIETAGTQHTSPTHTQQNLPLDAPGNPARSAVVASPSAILASMPNGGSLQQVETQNAAPATIEPADAGRSSRRRRRPTTTPDTQAASLTQVETSGTASAVMDTTPSTDSALHPTRRRQRPSIPVVNEPLVQVETQSTP